ncbi:MAG: CDP-alcohol phosphatidyltransferase family protein [Gemmatimonadales bacterium]|nr:CDP-alcohol phosphatidyltransferase family protein [Gemmatimonadales bacterium]
MKPLAVLERPFLATFRPLVDYLVRQGVRPNSITTFGTALVLLSAVLFGLGQVRLGGLFLLLSGLTDTIDGQVARSGAMVTRFGAFYDSTLDRIGDGATFIGIGTYFLLAPDVAWREATVIACMVAIMASLVVSYARARAEGLGLDCKVGIAQRAERIVLLGLPPLLFGAGPRGMLLSGIVAVLTLLALITVVQRVVHVHGAANAADAAGPQTRD